MIVAESVVKRYGAATVVDRVSLKLGDVGLTSLIGANGAGKSTLLSLIGRLLPADGGRITVDGLDVATTRSSELARRLAILRQDNHVTARLTVRELVAFGRYPHSHGRLTPACRTAVEDALAYLDLVELADRFLDQLSGGQRQRAHIAMVLAQDTPYVLLDEPLNNLDLRHGRDMMRLLRRAADDLGKKVVVVLHDVNVAAAHSDRIVALRDGRVVADGPPTDVVVPDVLSQVFGVEVEVADVGGSRIALHYR